MPVLDPCNREATEINVSPFSLATLLCLMQDRVPMTVIEVKCVNPELNSDAQTLAGLRCIDAWSLRA
jgi:hypothetical protein